MKKLGLSLLTILLFIILLFAGSVIYSLLVTLILKIPVLKFLANIFYAGMIEHAIEIGGIIILFFCVISLIESIIDKIDSTYTQSCMFILGIVLTVLYSLALVANIISIFVGGLKWRELILSIAMLSISIHLIKEKNIS